MNAIPFEDIQPEAIQQQYPHTKADIEYLEDDLAWKEFHLRQTAAELGKVQIHGAIQADQIIDK